MAEIKTERNFNNMTTRVVADFGAENDVHQLLVAIRERIVKALVDKFVSEHGEEVLASIDLEAVKKKTNDRVTTAALKVLANDSEDQYDKYSSDRYI